VSDSNNFDIERSAVCAPSDLASRLGPAAGAEPFAVRLLSRGELAALSACGLIEAGPSTRSAVGDTGYRLTRRGWEVVAMLWYDRGAQVREIAPVIPAS
jgi:hypothetical protein